MTQDKNPIQVRRGDAHEFLGDQFGQQRFPRLAVRVVLNFIHAPLQIARKLNAAASSVGIQLKAAYAHHLANISDASQALATQLTFAEINRISPDTQAQWVRDGKDSPIVAQAATAQRRIAPQVQNSLIEHCFQHTAAMQVLSARVDATLETLASLAESEDQRTRLNVAANVGPRMRIDEPGIENKKNEVFNRLVEAYESNFAPYLVPVCKSPEQIKDMYDNTSKTLGVIDVFVDNPYTPDSILLDIASSPKMQVMQHGAASRASDLLSARACHREFVSSHDGMAP